jgi:hypothetical protein
MGSVDADTKISALTQQQVIYLCILVLSDLKCFSTRQCQSLPAFIASLRCKITSYQFANHLPLSVVKNQITFDGANFIHKVVMLFLFLFIFL